MEWELIRLGPGMTARYEIADRRPKKVNAVEFGMGEAMLGVANRLIDAADAGVGVACVEAGESGYARMLNEQGGLYTVVVRGYEGETPVRREAVIQCVLEVHEADGLPALAGNGDLVFGIVDDSPEAVALALRFIELRRAAGLADIPMYALGAGMPDVDAPVYRALADGLAFRSEPDEAVRLCREMNYRDDMLYIAEPYARLTLFHLEAVRGRFPLDRAEGVRFAGLFELMRVGMLNGLVYDAGIFLMAAAGWLNGCDTLRDCMDHERLRRFVGEAFTEEILPSAALSGIDRAEVERCVIESFGRYADPLNRNRVLRAAGGLLGRFARGPLQLIQSHAEAEFEPPRRLAFALAATIMLYAGARQNPETGRYEVMRGKTVEALHDDPARIEHFATLSHDMPPESLAYAALADRELWGHDLREVDGLEARVALDIAAIQREPGFLPTA